MSRDDNCKICALGQTALELNADAYMRHLKEMMGTKPVFSGASRREPRDVNGKISPAKVLISILFLLKKIKENQPQTSKIVYL